MKFDQTQEVIQNGYFGIPRKSFGLDAEQTTARQLPEVVFTYTAIGFGCSAGLAIVIVLNGFADRDAYRVAAMIVALPFAFGLVMAIRCGIWEGAAWWDRHCAIYRVKPKPIKREVWNVERQEIKNSNIGKLLETDIEREFAEWCYAYSSENGAMPSERKARERFPDRATDTWLATMAELTISIGRKSVADGGVNAPGVWNNEISLDTALRKLGLANEE